MITNSSAGNFSVADPSWIFGAHLTKEADDFLRQTNTEFNEKQKTLEDKWLSGHTRYDLYLDKALLIITKPNFRIAFDIVCLGSMRTSDRTWEWAWNNPGVPTSMIFRKEAVASIADKFDLRYLKVGVVPVPNDLVPWYLGGIALKVSPDAVGVYSASDDGTKFFFLLFRPRVYQP